MSSRIPSSLVRRFDYRLFRPLPFTRDQWEEMMVLAEQNHWDPFPTPGFSFSGYRYTVYSPGIVRDLIVDYDDLFWISSFKRPCPLPILPYLSCQMVKH
jgi:hypothetical protein